MLSPELQAMRDRLADVPELDVDGELAVFLDMTGATSPGLFVGWLRAKKLIGEDLFLELQDAAQVSLSRLVGVEADGTIVTSTGAHAAPASKAAGGSRFVTLGRVGAGAMGEVFVAQDQTLLRRVALKRLKAGLLDDPEHTARFFGEVQVTAQLDHPNVVPIYELEVGADGGLAYAMKLVEGRTLSQILTEARDATDGSRTAEARRLSERLDAFLKVCDAMAFAHSKGVLHRDLKPDNVMVGRFSEVYVMDWGICRLIGAPPGEAPGEGGIISGPPPGGSDVHTETRYGAVIGTPQYMSPEQAQGRVTELDQRSDVYALGLVLFELIALRPALVADNVHALLFRAAEGELQPMVHHDPRLRVPRELRAIVDKATAREPDARYPSAEALAGDVRAYLRGDAVTARPDTPVQATLRFMGRHKLGTLVALLLVLLAGAGTSIGTLVRSAQLQTEAARHEERMQAFTLAVAQQAHDVDAWFFGFEKDLSLLAGRVRELVAHGEGALDGLDAERTYTSEDYDTPGHGPPDLGPAPWYGIDASFEHLVFKVAPGVDARAVAGSMQRLAHLRDGFTELMLSAVSADTSMTGERLRETLGVTGGPVIRTFVTLANGVHASYPGIGGYGPSYDGRKRPKYKLAAGRRGIVWGNPFVDRYGHGLILASSQAISDRDGVLLGVAGLEMTFTWLVDHLLHIPDAPYITDAWLVDEQANVIVSTSGVSLDGVKAGARIPTSPLPIPAVREALLGGRVAGHVEVIEGARHTLVAFYPVEALGWTYVAAADEAIMMGD